MNWRCCSIKFSSSERSSEVVTCSSSIVPRFVKPFAMAELLARVTYRKTWKYENSAMTDRSAVGIYFANASTAERPIDAVAVAGSRTIDEDVQVIAVRSEITTENAGDVRAVALMPDGSRALLVRFIAQREWPQRFWYVNPVTLPRGGYAM